MAEKVKVFDVVKPGSSVPDTGSKPMVVGHKMMKDPTLKDDNESSDLESNNEPIAQTESKTIQPLEQSEKISEDEVDKSLDADLSDEQTTNEAPTIDEPKAEEVKIDSTTESEPEKSEETKENKEKATIELSADREENLQKMINEKTYNVPIKEASVSTTKTFIKTFVMVVLLGILLIAILIDAEVIDLGISLPFDIL